MPAGWVKSKQGSQRKYPVPHLGRGRNSGSRIQRKREHSGEVCPGEQLNCQSDRWGEGGASYFYVRYGEVRWQNVAAGAVIGDVVGLTGGAAAAYLTAGSVTASTGAAIVGQGLEKPQQEQLQSRK